MLRLSGFADVIAAMERGRDIAVRAYTLSERLIREIESRANAGAHVSVTLEADPSGSRAGQLARHNANTAARLHACGVAATLERNVHAKTIAVDGTVFFDGSNWRDGDVILSDDAGDAAHLASRKSAALKEEAAMLERARSERESRVIVQTETFDRFNVVSKALRALAADGLSPRLLVNEQDLRQNGKEAASLAKIAGEGVEVRICDDTEKFALAGKRAWLGSANASSAFGGHDMTDWGVVTEDAAIVSTVRDRLDARWASARELRTLAIV